MKKLNTGDYFNGANHADLINNTLGTKYLDYYRSTVNLQNFGNDRMQAWFVFMNGSEHGYGEKYKFRNYLSNDENIIKEKFTGNNKEELLKWRRNDGFLPYRIAFQLDPDNENNRYKCKFIGVFVFSKFLNRELTSIEYKKVSNTFNLGSKFNNNQNVSKCNDYKCFIRNFNYSIQEIEYPEQIKETLEKANILDAGELLDLGSKNSVNFMKIIHSKLFNIFS